MKEIINITELAKLRKVSTETLRHYDRIGLLKPQSVDKKSGMRYYSIYQYEKIGTIKELQQLGMSLSEIKEYFENRNVQKTHELLLKINQNIYSQMEELNELNESVKSKIKYIENLLSMVYEEDIMEKEIASRFFLRSNSTVRNEIELSYQVIELENRIKKNEKLAPIFATNRYAGIIAKEEIDRKCYDTELVISIDISLRNEVGRSFIHVPGGKYICACYIGSFWDRIPTLENLLRYIENKSYILNGDVIQIEWYDYTITNNEKQIIYEIQMPVKKNRTP